jgi:phosphatidate cytidylyltransferase
LKRLATAAVAVPLALAALFLLPGNWWFLFLVLLFEGCVREYVAIARPRAPRAPLNLLLLLVPLAAVGLSVALTGGIRPSPFHLLSACLLLSAGIGTLVLLARVPLEESLAALGILGFGIPYFALPISSLHLLQGIDPWLVFLLMAIVWLGDTAAYYIGSRWGRHKLAPVVSPNKSWEGAAAGLATGVAVTAVWSVCRLGGLDWRLLAVGGVTSVAAQLGDLVESMIKRGTGVKDSGSLLPGHGGLLDRMDAMLFAAPALVVAAWMLGLEAISGS